MGFAFAALHWSPDQFWSSTPYELYAAIDTYTEIHGGKNSRQEWEDWAKNIKTDPNKG